MKPILRVDARRRDRALAVLARCLGSGECVVRAVDTYRASGRVTVQAPRDPAAELVAQEPPRLQPGGITEVVSYYRVRDPGFRELTVADGTIEREAEYVLWPVARASLTPPPAADA